MEKGQQKKVNMSSLGHSECPFTNLPSFTPLARRGKMACLAQHQTKHKREKFFALSVVVTKNGCRIDDRKMQSEICQLNADGPLHPERARTRKALQKRLRLEDRSVPKKHQLGSRSEQVSASARGGKLSDKPRRAHTLWVTSATLRAATSGVGHPFSSGSPIIRKPE